MIDTAQKIFFKALAKVDAGDAVRRNLRITDSSLRVCDFRFDLTSNSRIFVIAIGKAAFPMACAVDEICTDRISGGVLSGTLPLFEHGPGTAVLSPQRWKIFKGGHPVPNVDSLNAANAAIELLKTAEREHGIALFLISGGGSAMMEMPANPLVDIRSLIDLNTLLVNSGATIAEVNAVRKSVSAIKGGGLLREIPSATAITLIVSDTNDGDETTVASGPSVPMPESQLDPLQVIRQYDIERALPEVLLESINRFRTLEFPKLGNNHRSFVILSNDDLIGEASAAAQAVGFEVEIDHQVNETSIEKGCAHLFSRLVSLRRLVEANRRVCLLSGGEFGCVVKGKGIGGRNSETVLRLLQFVNESLRDFEVGNLFYSGVALLSAGSDGIDGNSPAAGSIACYDTIERAHALGLDPDSYLQNSDSFSFFHALGATIMTGPTFTNVRDLRLLIA